MNFDDDFDKHFDDIQKQQKSIFRLAKVGIVVAGSISIAGGCFMCWLLYTLVMGMVQ
jgi:hypothetical protein